ncbi:RING-H2 finger protein ATL80-like [Curcuma longa]|uniref:RING-H2 finger protein ATL80-like n=1 Tax=Curcuma longa TaxID=136217 RepID=UPI003D9E7FE6
MPPSARFLATSVDGPPPPLLSSPAQTTNTDVVVILASLLCAMVSVAGLTLVVRCVCAGRPPLQAAPGKGLEKKALRRLPKVSYGGGEGEGDGPAAECPICLAEFEEGDQLRMLPQCGHGFHVGCVDAWLRHHSSCPSCRRLLVLPLPPSRCQGCGEGSIDAAEPEPAPSAPTGALRP